MWIGLPPLAEPEALALLTKASPNDKKLLLALNRASERFRGAVGHPVSLIQNDVVTLGGDGGETLLLPAAPVADVSVNIADQNITDFQLSATDGVLRRVGGWPDGLGNIEITFTHGYEHIPGDIVDAVLEQASFVFQSLSGVQQVTQGGRSISFGSAATVGVTQRWSEAVERHRLRGLQP